jgi:murein tripeptide amidase MpaA
MQKAIWMAIGLFLHLTPLHADPLLTIADRTQFKQTGRYDEVIRLCGEFQREFPKEVRCFEFGKTPEGRPMKALVVSRAGLLDPKKARASGAPVLLFQGGIHAGEIDGKDASFLWLREALTQKPENKLENQHENKLENKPENQNDALKKVVVVIVPVFNIDGHERFGAHNRPNQVGPEEMGWRVTAQNLNLNRDYTKAEAPEMQAMLGLLNTWDPIVYVDMHVTDGAQFQHAISLNFSPNHQWTKIAGTPPGNAHLNALSAKLEEAVRSRLDENGFLPLTFYPEFQKEDEPTSGFNDEFSGPRFSQGYWSLRNRIGLLVETHSWKDYATRVRATHDTLESLVALAAQNGRDWVKAAHEADDAAAKSSAGSPFVLKYEATQKSHPIAFQGYAYKITQSKISGKPQISYDPSHKEVWNIPFFDELEPKTTVTLPKGGYLVEPAQAEWVSRKLRLHDIRYQVVHHTLHAADLETFRSESPKFSDKSFEGRQTLQAPGEWTSEKRDLSSGALFIPIAQPHAGLIAQLLEPSSNDSLLAWGFFNACFEQKEYMESYVNEDVAESMMKDPAIRAEFEKKLKDENFAKDPEKRLEFFYKKHPSWDEKFGLYPVYRIQNSVI